MQPLPHRPWEWRVWLKRRKVGLNCPCCSAFVSLLDKTSGLVAPPSARRDVGFIGPDNRKVGRTVGWAFDKISKELGEIGILVGNHRFRNQELYENGFAPVSGTQFRFYDPVTALDL